MAIKNRRLAGMRLAGRPDVDVTDQLRIAQEKLKEISAAQAYAAPDTVTYPENLEHSFEVDGHQIRLNANASRPYISEINLEDGKQYFGNRETYEDLAANTPDTEYGLTWSVDGSFYDDPNLDPRTKLKIARQVQREWPNLIGKMPENSIVMNSPVGASEGNYGRADLYMASGFGPIQDGGSQFGIVHGGQIQPISPQGVDPRHSDHLAGRARKAGDINLADAIAEANKKHQEMLRDYSGPIQPASNAKGGRYNDYDDYDDDYIPPATLDELRRVNEFIKSGEHTNPGSVPEIAIRQNIDDELGNRGPAFPLDTQDDHVAIAGDIQALRDAQVAMARQPAPGRDVPDLFQQISPRPTPERIDASYFVDDDGNRRYRGRGGYGYERQLENLPVGERRAAADAYIRQQIEDRSRRGRSLDERDLDSLKRLATDVNRGENGGLVNQDGVVVRELYSPEDVEALRRIQTQLAAEGEKNVPLYYGASRGERTEYLGPQLNAGENVEYLRQLSPQQEQDLNVIQEMVDSSSREQNMMDLVDSRFAPDTFDARPRLFHNIYGAQSVDELLANNPPSERYQNLTLDQASDIITRSVEQPGRTSSQAFADSLRLFREYQNNDIEQQLAVDLLNSVSRGPSRPISTSTSGLLPRPVRTIPERPTRRRGSRRPAPVIDETPAIPGVAPQGGLEQAQLGTQFNSPAPAVTSAVVNNPDFTDLLDSGVLTTRASNAVVPAPLVTQRTGFTPPRFNEPTERRRGMGSLNTAPQPVRMDLNRDVQLSLPVQGGGLSRALAQQARFVDAVRSAPTPNESISRASRRRSRQSPESSSRRRNGEFSDLPAGLSMNEFLQAERDRDDVPF